MSFTATMVFYLCLMTVRGLHGLMLVRALQEDAPPEDRASVLSLNALLFRVAFTIFGPPVGMAVERFGMSTSLAVVGGLLTVLALAAWTGFRHAHARAVIGKQPETA